MPDGREFSSLVQQAPMSRILEQRTPVQLLVQLLT
jgi:hypothetical protein